VRVSLVIKVEEIEWGVATTKQLISRDDQVVVTRDPAESFSRCAESDMSHGLRRREIDRF
jgi:hypothetical protein